MWILQTASHYYYYYFSFGFSWNSFFFFLAIKKWKHHFFFFFFFFNLSPRTFLSFFFLALKGRRENDRLQLTVMYQRTKNFIYFCLMVIYGRKKTDKKTSKKSKKKKKKRLEKGCKKREEKKMVIKPDCGETKSDYADKTSLFLPIILHGFKMFCSKIVPFLMPL